MEKIAKLFKKAEEQLTALNSTISSLDVERGELSTVKKQILDYKDKASNIKSSIADKKADLMTVLFDIFFSINGMVTHALGNEPRQIRVVIGARDLKYFEVFTPLGKELILMPFIGQERYDELFGQLWELMLKDITKYLKQSPVDLTKRSEELDTLKKQLVALPMFCQSVVETS